VSQTHPQEAVLEFSNLAVGYGSQQVLSGLSQLVMPGEFICLLGPNGAGKTTLLRTLAGLQEPLAGSVRLCGCPIEELSPAETARNLAVVLTERPTVQMLSALELVCLGRHPHTGFLGRLTQNDLRQARRAMEMVDAWHLAGRPLDQLSDGERQKLMLARALAQEPRLILLDEPTMHLDVKHRLEVMSILRELCRSQGIAVLASLHDVDLAVRLADVAGLIHRGGVMAWGPPEEVLDAERLVKLYGLKNARYVPQLGVIEPPFAAQKEAIFVACGGGSGAALLRLLAKKGYAINSGVLHEHDLDCQVAYSLGAKVAAQAPFSPISPAALDEAKQMLCQSRAVLDSGFPLGEDNQANRKLLILAGKLGIPLISLRPPEEMALVLGGEPQKCAFFSQPLQALAAMRDLIKPGEAAA
jgi:iron complex transport system ATP-binding protein